MNVVFTYDKSKDIYCIINKGRSSNNSPHPTGVYERMIKTTGDNPDEDLISSFINSYLTKEQFNVDEYVVKYQKQFDGIKEEFQKKAESVFKKKMEKPIIGYLTINNRCPYSVNGNWFMVTISKRPTSVLMISMHEIWHLYTWLRFGEDEKNRTGREKYNDIKESLTALLNIECKDLIPEGLQDSGYPQHKRLRERVVELWNEKKDIDYVWNTLAEEI